MRLKDKVVLITGAGSGIGRAGAELFAAEGARVVVADINDAGAKETVDLVRGRGGEAVAVVGDVGRAEDNEAAVRTALDTYGGLDVVWANAGLPQAFRSITEVEPDEFDRIMAVNARGPWLAARAALPVLRERGGGSFIITASLSGLKGRPDASAYQASKGAATMLTKSLAREFGPFQIRVNSVCPLAAETPMWAKFMDNYMDKDEAAVVFAKAVPLERLATADDVAKAALFFASDDSTFVTGVNLPVDGGSLA
jgi:3-oxoacyl-[acyl-carrier protein] reductase